MVLQAQKVPPWYNGSPGQQLENVLSTKKYVLACGHLSAFFASHQKILNYFIAHCWSRFCTAKQTTFQTYHHFSPKILKKKNYFWHGFCKQHKKHYFFLQHKQCAIYIRWRKKYYTHIDKNKTVQQIRKCIFFFKINQLKIQGLSTINWINFVIM